MSGYLNLLSLSWCWFLKSESHNSSSHQHGQARWWTYNLWFVDNFIICFRQLTSISLALESNTTFGSLAEQMMASNIDEDDSDEGYLPDFYLRKQDPKHNCVTTSGQWWEVQDGETLVNSRKSTGKGETQKVELVVRNKDYVIALLNDEGNERGIPVGSYTTLSNRTILTLC